MNATDTARIAAWLAATDIAELELRGPGVHLRLRGGGAAPAEPAWIVVTAPSVGAFLHSHPLYDAPLAPPGTLLCAGQPLGLLRIGTLLLPVAAPAPGIIGEKLVPHEGIVGFGTRLALLHPVAE